jgi:hypothetical protein
MNTLTAQQLLEAFDNGFRIVTICPDGARMFKNARELNLAIREGKLPNNRISFSIRNMIGFADY